MRIKPRIQSKTVKTRIKPKPKTKSIPNLTTFLKSASFIAPGSNTTPDALKQELNTGEETEDELTFEDATNKYQDFSYSINGFLRKDVVNYYSDLSITEILTKCGKEIQERDIQDITLECINQDIQKTFAVIDTLDYIFDNALCPKMKNKTVLFRGSDRPYEKNEMTGKKEIENKAYISTTKTLNNLFEMQKRGDAILSSRNNCCINILIVDEGVPYLDLEMPNKWSYQQEVLLPRGLIMVLLGEYMYENYATYVYRVKLATETYEIPPEIPSIYHNVVDPAVLIEPEKMIHLLTVQKEKVLHLKQIVSDSEIIDKIDDVYDELDTYSSNAIRFYCEKTRYHSIISNFRNKLKEMNELVIRNNLQTPEYEKIYNEIMES